MLQVDPIKSYLNLKNGLPPVLKVGASGMRERSFVYLAIGKRPILRPK